jgi:phospholipid transport system substrate-binding protein
MSLRHGADSFCLYDSHFLASGGLFACETGCRPCKIEGLKRAAAWHLVCMGLETQSLRVFLMDRTIKPALTASLLLIAVVSLASAPSPTEVVQAAAEQVVRVVQDPTLAGPAAAERRRQAIQRIVENLFDFPEMTRRSLGRHWTDRTVQEREEFTRLFKGILEHSYFGKIENYSGQRILYLSEAIDGESATVRSMVTIDRKNELSVEYRLHLVGAQWTVYDVVLDGISLVSTYGAQFNRIIQNSSYDHLVDEMRLKEAQLTTRKQTGPRP